MLTLVRLGKLWSRGLSAFFMVILEDPLELAVYRLQSLFHLLQHLPRRSASLSAASTTLQRAADKMQSFFTPNAPITS